MKKYIIIALLSASFMSTAQNYELAAGLRGGFGYGVTGKYFISDNAAVEGIVNSLWKNNGFIITGLYEIHTSAFDIDEIKVYYGGGAHIGFWSSGGKWIDPDGDEGGTIIGVDGILGIEYTFLDIPINVSIDWKPAINFTSNGLWFGSGAFSARYIFK